MEGNKILIGCIADDFTGAGDAASFLAKSGLRTILQNGVPADVQLEERCDAVVIALKTRSVSPKEASEQTLRALQWLKRAGTKQFYIKYCSTFDSTPVGNIGPAVDIAIEFLDVPYTLLCPSLPTNGRTVKAGKLYVHGVPLERSSMRNHPLNPMWDSYIPALMRGQSKYPCIVPDKSIEENIGQRTGRFYLVPDYETDDQGRQIVERFGHLPLLTGGSGLLEHLSAKVGSRSSEGDMDCGTSGRGIILCGSCSQMTSQQIEHFRSKGGACIALDPQMLFTGKKHLEDLWETVCNSQEPILIYSTRPALLLGEKKDNSFDAAQVVERAMAELGRRAVKTGFNRIIVAGGETSGAVMQAMRLNSFRVGPSIAPGVPVLIPVEQNEVRIVLKSGNFGQDDFFERALSATARKRQSPQVSIQPGISKE